MRKIIEGYPGGARLEALVIKDNAILTIHRINHGNEYYVLPGGGWEEGETKEEGVKREVREETSLDVEVVRPVFSLLLKDDSQKFVYLCNYLGGEPKLGDYNEKAHMDAGDGQFYEPVWVPIKDLPNLKLYTLEFRDWFLENYKDGKLPENPVVMEINREQFRQI